MSKSKVLYYTRLVGSVCLLSFAVVCWGQVRSQGTEPYTPGKLEWLAVRLNAEKSSASIQEYGYDISFYPEEKNTIVLRVVHTPNVNREWMNEMVELRRDDVKKVAAQYGWNWVRIREEYIKIK